MLMKNNCFHCDLEGHQTLECPKRDEPQTAEGKEVQKAFFRSRKVRIVVVLISPVAACIVFKEAYFVSYYYLLQ